MQDLYEFLEPVDRFVINDDQSYNDGQLANFIQINEGEIPDISNADIVIAGVNEERGTGSTSLLNVPDAIRKELYQLHSWHKDVAIADLGNIKTGERLQDSY